jgi:lipid II:glycine glycyltransferase (peptidoglycan interpeptide bridge formation enzyme)
MMGSKKSKPTDPLCRLKLPPLDLDPKKVGEGQRSLGGGVQKSFMQSPFWAGFKASTGWKAYFFDYCDKTSGDDSLVVLVRPLGLGLSFAYIPHGPRLPHPGIDKGKYLENLAQAVLSAIKDRILFLRFDLDWELDTDCSEGEVFSPGLRLRRGSAVQVPDTVLLDLRLEEPELLAAMKPKWRYNIKLAEKKGVQVTRQGSQALGAFYKLYKETASRDGIAIHPLEYYEKLFAAAADSTAEGVDKPELSVWVASHESQALAAIITLFCGTTATYLYGASSGEKRNLMPAYALQWAAIQTAKEKGCRWYDFFGIPPTAEPGHPMAGLYLFKTGFGGRIVHRLGSVDYPGLPLLYGLFRAAEHLRLFWYKKIRKALSRARS